MSRSTMHFVIMNLLREGAITLADLADFSEDLQETMEHFYGRG